jgi:hypothetical protein
MQYLEIIDKIAGGLIGLLNLLGASQTVSDIIAKRIAEKREWTDEERQKVDDELKASKAYAAEQLAKPD